MSSSVVVPDTREAYAWTYVAPARTSASSDGAAGRWACSATAAEITPTTTRNIRRMSVHRQYALSAREAHAGRHDDFDGLAVQSGRRVGPLPDGCQRGFVEAGYALQHDGVTHGAVNRDNSFNHHGAGETGRLRGRGILRRDVPHLARLDDVTANANRPGRSRCGCCRCDGGNLGTHQT